MLKMSSNRPFFTGVSLGITDYNGKELFEGDLIKHPESDQVGVIRYEPSGCQFRIQYDPESFLPSAHVGLQMGEKGKAVKIGSIYETPELLGWEYKALKVPKEFCVCKNPLQPDQQCPSCNEH